MTEIGNYCHKLVLDISDKFWTIFQTLLSNFRLSCLILNTYTNFRHQCLILVSICVRF